MHRQGKSESGNQDNYLHKGLRKHLVETIRNKGISDSRVLEVIGTLPRHLFLDKAFQEKAYEDIPFPIGAGQTISQPFTVAYQTELLGVQKHDKILEIGTGSGYQACVLSMMGARVYSIERQEDLFHKTNIILKKLGFENIKTFLKDGYKGLPAFAPFDKIIITAATTIIPPELVKQIRVGGIMIFPKGEQGRQVMCVLTKNENENYTITEKDYFTFVPMLEGVIKSK